MQLVNLLFALDVSISPKLDRKINDICHDSRKATDGSVFVCIKGADADGHNYARSAYNKGCRVFIVEDEVDLPEDAITVKQENTRIALARLSAAFYRHPSGELKIIGITGTKGKTTTALFIHHILNENGIKAGYIGSNGIDFDSYHFDTVNTTPESLELHKYMRRMVECGVKWLVMEVSSQALYLERVHGINFDVCIFTNLSPDHIGDKEHPTFEHYRDSKRSLFRKHSPKYIICNYDDAATPDMIRDTSARVISFSATKSADYSAEKISLYRDSKALGVSFRLRHGPASEDVFLAFPGEFSVYNAMAALAAASLVGVELKSAVHSLASARIRGRFETYFTDRNVTFVIDYAHNKVSLSSALSTLRRYEPKRLICLFGSVGGRTFERRRELAEVASALADLSIITSDNPDSEPPMNTIDEIASYFSSGAAYMKIADRKDAILKAIDVSEEGDIVLLAGKGHEDYQLVSGKKLPFSEREILTSAITSPTKAVK